MKEALEVAVLNLIAPIGVITSFLFIWFKTDFFLSYLKLFNFKFPDYEKQSIENPDLFFFEYLACKNSSSKFKFFIFKLMSCEFCLCAWVSLGVSLFYSLNFIGIYYVFSLFLFKYLENCFFKDD
jgi:hypothetical protein